MVSGLAYLILLAPAATVEDLVEVEATFSRALQVQGSKRAYAEVLAPKGIRFRSSDGQRVVSRKPLRAGLARGENWGYTSGTYSAKDPSGKSQGGHFVSVWRRNGGAWRLLFDFGAPSVVAHSPFRAVGARFPHKIVAEPDDAAATLIATDRALAENTGAISEFLDPRATVVRSRSGLLDLDRAVRAMQSEAWSPIKALVSPSADLGCTYGATAFQEGGRGDYVRIWARDEQSAWRIVLDFGAKR